MSLKNKCLLGVFFVIFSFGSQAQEDSVFRFDAYLDLVMTQHPQVFRADLKRDEGEAVLKQAKGSFDPLLGGDMKQKYFSGSQYYSQMNGYLKVPSWFGLSAEVGYDNSGGVYLNPADRLPDAGLWYAGINLELGNGLLIDKRRAELKKARIFQESNELERRLMRNELKFNASSAYWKWSEAYLSMAVHRDAVQTALERFEAVKEYVAFGDRPEIDLVEAEIQYQTRQIDFEQALLDLQNAEEYLELFLWDQGVVPLELDGSIPEGVNAQLPLFSVAPNELDSLILAHPMLEMNTLSLEKKSVDLRLQQESLKPKVSLKYRALNEPVSEGFFDAYSVANYTWGASVQYALFTRSERGNVALARVQLEELQFKQSELLTKLEYGITVSMNQLNTLRTQMEVWEAAVANYERMASSENELFQNGESSLFMVNSRELKLLEAQLKSISVRAKYATAWADLEFQSMRAE